jgi:hypothetical protein
MAMAIGLWVRNTALRLRQEGVDLTKNMLGASHVSRHEAMYTQNHLNKNPYDMDIGNGNTENLTWLLG